RAQIDARLRCAIIEVTVAVVDEQHVLLVAAERLRAQALLEGGILGPGLLCRESREHVAPVSGSKVIFTWPCVVAICDIQIERAVIVDIAEFAAPRPSGAPNAGFLAHLVEVELAAIVEEAVPACGGARHLHPAAVAAEVHTQ